MQFLKYFMIFEIWQRYYSRGNISTTPKMRRRKAGPYCGSTYMTRKTTEKARKAADSNSAKKVYELEM